MSKPNKKRIPTSSEQSGFINPFAGALDSLSNLAPDPAEKEPEKKDTSAKKIRVLLRKETAHRAGTAVIIVHGFPETFRGAEIEELARELKKGCGSGGTVKGREIEIQGDRAPQIRQFLEKQGFRVDGVR